MQEKVSVIVPIYNVEPYLKRCLDSLLAQIHKNLEVLLVDDCSTDGSALIAKEYAQVHSERFFFIQREHNGGLSAARNTGMAAATGEWLAFVDSDDWVTEDYISAMYQVAKQDQADIVMSSLYYYYPDGKYKEMSPFGDLTTQSSHQEKVALSRPYAVTRLFNKKFVDLTNLHFPTNVWRAAEQGMTIPLLTRSSRISIIRRPMYFYLQRADSNSNNNRANIDVSFFIKSCENVYKNSAPDFERELEFRAVSDLMYAMILVMIRSQKPKSEIIQQIDFFHKQFPKWKNNPYIPNLPKGKRIFIQFAARKQYFVLKCLVLAWDTKQKFKH